ncbi:hypothetical protein DAEQUDRAFT_737983 [Daedalea quercina L-15889]|uniref:Uncharacterized protein n=1 Tax=Daedalea quercina L-15889 TaxID=1314783 RepID=A0A165QIF7_9APHY|nr:hypothetical protein DAEQUDRAFT_737983 [Daedalea quercina L-15889]
MSCPSPSAFPIDEAQLVSLFMESITYGIHAVTFTMCMYTWFTDRRKRHSRSWPWMSVAVILFAIGTLDVSFNFYHNLEAFLLYKGTGGAEAVFDRQSNWANVMRSVWARLSAMISDAALICRCYIVYAKFGQRWQVDAKFVLRWTVAGLPVLLWLGATACAIGDIVMLSTLDSSCSIPDTPSLRQYLTGYYVMTLVLNVLATGLIVYRIWDVHHQTTAFVRHNWLGSDRIANVIRIFVESALLYTVSVAVSVIVELAKSNAYYGTSDTSVELAGITFDLIIIRIWRGITAEQTPAFVQSLDRERAARRHTRGRISVDSLDIATIGIPKPVFAASSDREFADWRDARDEESYDHSGLVPSPIAVHLHTVSISVVDKNDS